MLTDMDFPVDMVGLCFGLLLRVSWGSLKVLCHARTVEKRNMPNFYWFGDPLVSLA